MNSIIKKIMIVILLITLSTIFIGCSIEDDSASIAEQEEQEKILKAELAQDKPDILPTDIVIPSNASEEEIVELNEKIAYWKITQMLKNTISKCISKSASEMAANEELDIYGVFYGFQSVRRINNIYTDYNGLYVDCDVLYNKYITSSKTCLKQSNCLFIINSNNAILEKSSYSDIISFISSDTTCQIHGISSDISCDETEIYYKNYLEKSTRISLYKELYDNVELIKIDIYAFSSKGAPIGFIVTVKITDESNVYYIRYWLNSGTKTYDMTFDEWKEYSYDINGYGSGILYLTSITFYDTEFDWLTATSKYAK